MRNTLRCRVALGLTLVIFLAVACSQKGELSPTPLPTTGGIINAPTSGMLPTGEIIPTLTPEWKPLPTLSLTESASTILALYENNGGCELPCWWGITPGETTMQDAFQVLTPLGITHGPWVSHDVRMFELEFSMPAAIDDPQGVFRGKFSPSVFFKDNRVIAIDLNTAWVKRNFDFSLAGLLQAFGPPDEIWLKTYPQSQFQPHYTLDLFYKGKGIEFGATGNATVQDNTFTICPQDFMQGIYPPSVFLWQPSEEITYRNRGVVLTGGSAFKDVDDFFLLDEVASDFSAQKFYETYLDPSTTACFDIDLSKLP